MLASRPSEEVIDLKCLNKSCFFLCSFTVVVVENWGNNNVKHKTMLGKVFADREHWFQPWNWRSEIHLKRQPTPYDRSQLSWCQNRGDGREIENKEAEGSRHGYIYILTVNHSPDDPSRQPWHQWLGTIKEKCHFHHINPSITKG